MKKQNKDTTRGPGFRMTQDRIAVKDDDVSQESKGGILLPDNAREKPVRGTVLAIGPGKRDFNGNLFPPDVKPGDRIAFARYTGTEHEINDVKFRVLNELDILLVLES